MEFLRNMFRFHRLYSKLLVCSTCAYFSSQFYINKLYQQEIQQSSNQFNQQKSKGKPYQKYSDELRNDQDHISEDDIVTSISKLYFVTPSSDQQSLKIFCGNSSRELAKEIVSHLDIQLGRSVINRTESTESLINIFDNVQGQKVFIIQSMSPPKVSDNIVELLLMISAMKRSGASKVICVIPYFAYQRQTQASGPRMEVTGISGSAISNMLVTMGCDMVITINFANKDVKGFFPPEVPMLNIDVSELIVPYLINKGIDQKPVLISSSPKRRLVKNVVQLQEAFAQKNFICDIGCMSRKTINKLNVNLPEYLGPNIYNRDCIFITNIIDEGKHMKEYTNLLLKNGAKRVFYFAPHGLFSKQCIQNIKNSFVQEIIITNTVSEHPNTISKIKTLSVAKFLAEIIALVHKGVSVEDIRQKKSLKKHFQENPIPSIEIPQEQSDFARR